jgi:hypothetical protein
MAALRKAHVDGKFVLPNLPGRVLKAFAENMVEGLPGGRATSSQYRRLDFDT